MATKAFTLSPQGTIGSFTVEGATVRSKGRLVIQPAPGAKVALVDVVGRQSSDPQDHIIMDGFIGQLTKAGYTIRYDTNVRSFFDPKARWQEFLKTGDTQGLELTDEQKKVAQDFQALYQLFETSFTLPKPPYRFATDEQKGPDTPLKITGAVRPNVSRGNGYRATLNTAKRVWDRVSKVWQTMDQSLTTQRVNVPHNIHDSFDGYNRTVTVFANRLEIGCQTIGRRSLEQFAVAQGWDFPEA